MSTLNPQLAAALDAWITRPPEGDVDYEAMAAEIDAAEAREANTPCLGCGLPRGAHTDAALDACGAVKSS